MPRYGIPQQKWDTLMKAFRKSKVEEGGPAVRRALLDKAKAQEAAQAAKEQQKDAPKERRLLGWLTGGLL